MRLGTFDIFVDVQGDFIHEEGKLAVLGAYKLIPRLQEHIRDLDRSSSKGALFTFDTHIKEIYEQSEEAKKFPLHCERDTDGWQLAVNPFKAPVPIYWLEKPVFDMWQEKHLRVQRMHGLWMGRESFFQSLQENGIHTLRVCGVASDYCVKDAVAGALQRGFAVDIIGELTAGIERDIEQVVREEFPGQPVRVI